MRWGLISASVGIAVTAVFVVGCSAEKPGTPTPAPRDGGGGETTSATTEQSTPPTTGGAPRVSNPLDASNYLSQPCNVLSAAALQSFNISKPGKPDVDSEVAKTAGPACSWSNDDQPISAGYNVGFLTGNKRGLSDTYRGRDRFKGYFEPTEVEGYPAVFNDANDGRPNGSCNMTIGISDTLAFRTAATLPHELGAKSCDEARKVAIAVIQTLKGA